MKSYDEIAERVIERRDKYIEKQKKKRKAAIRAVAMVSCFCLAVIAALGIWGRTWLERGADAPAGDIADAGEDVPKAPTGDIADTLSQPQNDDEGSGGVYIPKKKVVLSYPEDVELDMIGFFIYEGRVYEQYVQDGASVNSDTIGEYLGTATGMLDEWSEADGYVDYAGSVSGDFYAVDGFDPSFLLCLKLSDDVSYYCINDNDLTLKTGADLFEERLGMKGNIASATYQTRENWYYSAEAPSRIETSDPAQVDAFVDALCDAPFLYVEDIPLEHKDSSVYDEKEIYHVFVNLENGFTVHLRLFEGGYVSFAGVSDVCVKVDQDAFDCFVALLEK